MSKKRLDRPCWRCGYVLPAEEAQRLRDKRYLAATCPKCGARIGLRGPPYGTRIIKRRRT
jgi:DNA-directed RNA polymerase subunit RPC12/RpoP